MEATAMYAFNATNREELSFPAGVVLKILEDDDKDWYKAEYNGQEGYAPANYVNYVKPDWYMALTKAESIKTLTAKKPNGTFQHPDGAFVVRPSENQRGEKSLSVRIGNDVQHFRILRPPTHDQYFLWNDSPHFTSINQLVAHYHTQSVSKTGNARLRDMKQCRARAEYDFVSRTPEELSLRTGDIINVTSCDDPDWWQGSLERDGSTGIFPANYVTLLQ